MNTEIFLKIKCPKCGLAVNLQRNALCCSQNHVFPVTDEIPRFVEPDNYAESFGFEWETFAKTQVDKFNSVGQSEWRIRNELLWGPEDFNGKLVLDAGCGSGRFTEVLTRWGARVVALDYSYSVDSAKENLDSSAVQFIQGDILKLPFKDGVFDMVLCIGVIQHTPNPLLAVNELCRVVKAGGKLGLSGVYLRDLKHLLHPKYLFRPITKRIPPRLLFGIVRKWVGFALPISRFLRKKAHIKGGLVERLLAVANYEGWVEGINDSNVYEWALLDTFDWFSPQFDNPVTFDEVTTSLKLGGMGAILNTSPGSISFVSTKI